MSRIYGGIHFMSANTQGLASGARLGQFVMDIFLKQAAAQKTVEMPDRDSSFYMALRDLPNPGRVDRLGQ